MRRGRCGRPGRRGFGSVRSKCRATTGSAGRGGGRSVFLCVQDPMRPAGWARSAGDFVKAQGGAELSEGVRGVGEEEGVAVDVVG